MHEAQTTQAQIQLFSRIAARYDLINRLLSLGQDRRWREIALAQTYVPPRGWLLDVATGTGETALLAKAHSPQITVVGVDVTAAMLNMARRKQGAAAVHWMRGDGLRLPFPNGSFDAAVSVFMMRNVPDVRQALAEQRRVVREGGRVVCLEMTWPRRFPMSWLFSLYFFGLSPLIGGVISGNLTAYRYLPRSVHRFLSPQEMTQIMEAVGLRDVAWRLLMRGTVMVHWGSVARHTTSRTSRTTP